MSGGFPNYSVKNPPESVMNGYTQEVMAAIRSSRQPAREWTWPVLSVPSVRIGFGVGTALAGFLLFLFMNRPANQGMFEQKVFLPAEAPEITLNSDAGPDLLDQIQEVDRFIIAKTFEEESPLQEEQDSLNDASAPDEDLLEQIKQIDEAGFAFS